MVTTNDPRLGVLIRMLERLEDAHRAPATRAAMFAVRDYESALRGDPVMPAAWVAEIEKSVMLHFAGNHHDNN
jgi:hypothetical protein